MDAKQLEKITGCLTKLHGYAYFRPQDGLLTERLRQEVLDGLEGEQAEELAEVPFDLEVSVGDQEGEPELNVSFSVDHPGVSYTSQLALKLLSDDEAEELAGYLVPLVEKAPNVEDGEAGTAIVRKKSEETEHHLIASASARLKVTPEWLKSVIPCTDYSYEEIDGKKYIREYFWSKELIERLVKIRSTKTTPEDLQYVAAECCHGDMEWAKDLISRVKSPNRPEPAPREQAQKGQGKGAQVKGGSAKPAQRGAQAKGGPGKPSAGKQQQPQGASPARAAAGNAPQEKPAGGNAQQPSGTGERTRSRSRHKRFRDRKDAGAKGEPAGGQKQPPQ